jgi:hypothetical protein
LKRLGVGSSSMRASLSLLESLGLVVTNEVREGRVREKVAVLTPKGGEVADVVCELIFLLTQCKEL